MIDEEEKRAAAGRNFRRAMDRAGVRQSDVISRTGASPSQVSNWCKRGVSAQFAGTVAEYLKVMPHQISLVRDPYGEGYVRSLAGVEQPHYVMEQKPPGPLISAHVKRLIEALEEANLSAADSALLEQLVERLSKD